jgi:hypothetical protein
MLTEVDATRFSDVYQENLAVPGAPPHPVPYKKSNDVLLCTVPDSSPS